MLSLTVGGLAACATNPPDTQTPSRPERETRTAAQKKIDSQLLFEIYRARGIAAEKKVPPDPTMVRVDAERRAFVDVRTEPTAAMLEKLKKLGASITTTSVQTRTILAWIPLLKLEELADDSSVSFIQPAPQAIR